MMKRLGKILICIVMIACLAISFVMPAFAEGDPVYSISINVNVGDKLYPNGDSTNLLSYDRDSLRIESSWKGIDPDDGVKVFEVGNSYTLDIYIHPTAASGDSIKVSINGTIIDVKRGDSGYYCTYVKSFSAPTTTEAPKPEPTKALKPASTPETTTTAPTKEKTTQETPDPRLLVIYDSSKLATDKLLVKNVDIKVTENKTKTTSDLKNSDKIIGSFSVTMTSNNNAGNIKDNFGRLDLEMEVTNIENGQKLYVLEEHDKTKNGTYIMTNGTVTNDIKETVNENGWSIVKETLNKLYIQKETTVINGKMKISDIVLLSDFYVSTEPFVFEDETTTAEPETTTAAPLPVDNEKGGLSIIVIVAIIVAAVLIIAGIVAVVLLKKKEDKIPLNEEPVVETNEENKASEEKKP
ncbi:MAG: hypothetical protein MJ115_05915, partial [Clostridia bacterium]|nr:hypothetical protein [Clostridia bacterium]